MKNYKKLSLQCILFSVLGMLVLIISKYIVPGGSKAVPDILFWSMLTAGGVVLFIGILGYAITTVALKKWK